MWTQEEDAILKEIVQSQQHRKWAEVAQILHDQYAVYKRTGKQCRERWVNYLDPSIKSSDWTYEEEQRMFAFQAKFGNKWSEIAKELDGRPYNCIKNHFYSALRKGLRKINLHIQARFKRSEARPVSSHFLSKVLLLTEEKDGPRRPRKSIQEKCVEIKNELIHYSQDHPASKSDDERLDKLVQLILSVNRIYRNKKRRRKSNRGPRVVQDAQSPVVNYSKVEHQSIEPQTVKKECLKPLSEEHVMQPVPTAQQREPSPGVVQPQCQHGYGSGLIWVFGVEQQQHPSQVLAYQQYVQCVLNQPIYGISHF